MLQNSTIMRVLEPFFHEPTKKHYLMDISRNIDLAHTSVKKELKLLVKEKLVIETIEKKGTRDYPVYTANLSNEEFKRYKKADNTRHVISTGLIKHISETLAPRCIVLFGSYDRGEDTEDSDIDLFVECPQEQFSLKRYELLLKRKIQLHMNKSFLAYPNELKNNIINGTVLYGFLEGYR